MVTTTPSVPDSSSSVFATDALSRLQGELAEDLCTVAIRLAQYAHGESLRTGVCAICGSAGIGNAMFHDEDCVVGLAYRVAGRLEVLRLELRLAQDTASAPERKIVYRAPCSSQASEIPVPVGFSHVEAAVLHAARVPWEQRSAIYAEAIARQAADRLESSR